MEPRIDFFCKLDDGLVDNNFFIQKRLFRTNGIHLIKGYSKNKTFYKIEYNENSLTITIHKRSWLQFKKITEIKARIDSEFAIKKKIQEVLNLLE